MIISDKYTMITKKGKSIVVEMKLTGEYIEEEMQEVLQFIAQKSKQFYLKAGDEINDKLSKKEEKIKIADEIAKLELQRRHLQEQIDKKIDYLLNIDNGIRRNNRDIAEYEEEIKLEENKKKFKYIKTMIEKLHECNKDNLENKQKLENEVSEFKQQLSELSQVISYLNETGE